MSDTTVPVGAEQDVLARFRLYLQNRTLRETAQGFEEMMKGDLMRLMANPPEGLNTTTDEKQSLFVWFPTPVSGGKRTVVGMKRERRSSLTLNQERVDELLAAKGLPPETFYTTEEIPARTETYLDEDKVLAASFEETITDAELRQLYDEKVTYAFVLVDG